MDQTSLHKIADCLNGSPYSIPLDQPSRNAVITILGDMLQLEKRAEGARAEMVDNLRGLLGLRKGTRTREIFESNSIEGLGTSDLAATFDILNRPDVATISQASRRYQLFKALDADILTRAALGLHSAKLFAEELAADSTRPLTEVDLRTMHGLILGTAPGSGTYRGPSKEFRIGDSTHIPPDFYEVPAHMRELVSWVLDATANPLIPKMLVAVVAHAWLTHIHPFIDGNGRMARLWVNMILSTTPLPALIIRNQLDRGHYIDALQISDAAGDVAPLIEVFTRAAKRGVKEMENPQYAIDLFDAEIARRGRGPYEQWLDAISTWLTDVAALLQRHNCHVTPLGSMDLEAFTRYARGDEMRAVILAEITCTTHSGARIILVLRRPRSLKRAAGAAFPAIHLYRRSARVAWNRVPYRRVMTDEIEEIVVKPTTGHRHEVVLRTKTGIKTGFDSDMGPIVDGLNKGFQSGDFRSEW